MYTLTHQKSEELRVPSGETQTWSPSTRRYSIKKLGGGFWHTSDFVFINTIWSFHSQNFLPTFHFNHFPLPFLVLSSPCFSPDSTEKYTLTHQKKKLSEVPSGVASNGKPLNYMGGYFDQKIGGGFWHTSDFCLCEDHMFSQSKFIYPTFFKSIGKRE